MDKVVFALPDLYPDAGFPTHTNNRELRNTLNFNARECPVCKYQSPLEGWENWYAKRKLKRRQWDIINDKVATQPAMAF